MATLGRNQWVASCGGGDGGGGDVCVSWLCWVCAAFVDNTCAFLQYCYYHVCSFRIVIVMCVASELLLSCVCIQDFCYHVSAFRIVIIMCVPSEFLLSCVFHSPAGLPASTPTLPYAAIHWHVTMRRNCSKCNSTPVTELELARH